MYEGLTEVYRRFWHMDNNKEDILAHEQRLDRADYSDSYVYTGYFHLSLENMSHIIS